LSKSFVTVHVCPGVEVKPPDCVFGKNRIQVLNVQRQSRPQFPGRVGSSQLRLKEETKPMVNRVRLPAASNAIPQSRISRKSSFNLTLSLPSNHASDHPRLLVLAQNFPERITAT
jgi:hypothetical protein